MKGKQHTLMFRQPKHIGVYESTSTAVERYVVRVRVRVRVVDEAAFRRNPFILCANPNREGTLGTIVNAPRRQVCADTATFV